MNTTYSKVQSYRVVRFFERLSVRGPYVLRTGLTREAAKAHCANPETSSGTCTTAARRRYTRLNGRWFDGWQAE